MDLDYERDIVIDHTALDVEWVQQPTLMLRYAEHAALMKKEMDETKERFDLRKAQIEMKVRGDPEGYGVTKVTESAIQSIILQQPEYQLVAKEYIDARYEYDVATAAVRAIDQRKTALENLVRLLLGAYFAGPQAPRDLSQEWEKYAQQRASNTRIRIGRKEE